MTFEKYLQPSLKEQSTTLPIPVFLLYSKATNVAVMPSEEDTKSAKKFVGNSVYLFPLLIKGTIPDTEI